METDGFVLVQTRRNNGRKRHDKPTKNPKIPIAPSTDITTTRRLLRQKCEDLEGLVDEFKVVIDQIAEKTVEMCLERSEDEKILRLICFGLGSFSTMTISLWQLAFVLELERNMTKLNSEIKIEKHAFDPAFNEIDIEILKSDNGFIVSETNIECRYIAQIPSLIFMPHCNVDLYTNLFLANINSINNNQDILKNIILIGNDFNDMYISLLKKIDDIPLNKIDEYIDEVLKFHFDLEFKDIYKKELTEIWNFIKLEEFKVLNKKKEGKWLKVIKNRNEIDYIHDLFNNISNNSINDLIYLFIKKFSMKSIPLIDFITNYQNHNNDDDDNDNDDTLLDSLNDKFKIIDLNESNKKIQLDNISSNLIENIFNNTSFHSFENK